MKLRRKGCRWGVCAAGTMLFGCAVMTIDVDVYKGPLSNHRTVQTGQASVMAIAAKPVLIDLRNRLEWGKNFEWGVNAPQKYQGEGFISDDSIPPLSNDQARRVNAVLSLYEDKVNDPEIAAWIRKGGIGTTAS